MTWCRRHGLIKNGLKPARTQLIMASKVESRRRLYWFMCGGGRRRGGWRGLEGKRRGGGMVEIVSGRTARCAAAST